MSDSDVVAKEAAEARQAVQQSWDELKASLGEAADLRQWTRQHPWAAIGVAAAAGFAAATAVTPRKDQTIHEKLSALVDAVHSSGAKAPQKEPRRGESPTFYQTLIFSLFDLARVALGNWLMQAIQGTSGQDNGAAAVRPSPAESTQSTSPAAAATAHPDLEPAAAQSNY